jgi:hypothetical protein
VCQVFTGIPALEAGQAILFDSAAAEDAGKLPDEATIAAVVLRSSGGVADPQSFDPGLTLLLFVDDLSQPRARVKLRDLLRQGGERPLNLRLRAGQRLQVVLQDANRAWAQSAPAIEVELRLD